MYPDDPRSSHDVKIGHRVIDSDQRGAWRIRVIGLSCTSVL